ncbi:hypothetical protein DERF_004200 [Dermatophagoides farinae]|uniref:Uncharacterized protein n=1 Tax=Dermatophagoides farinae TaxID=6954 RepID=A0A922L4W1_DERFA|nr:hypothetical protein DERF_004200 [Dermatophagoides farinae]
MSINGWLRYGVPDLEPVVVGVDCFWLIWLFDARFPSSSSSIELLLQSGFCCLSTTDSSSSSRPQLATVLRR